MIEKDFLMKKILDKNNPNLKEDDSIFGYRIKRIAELEQINSFFYSLEHNVTGAKHIHISNNDKENTFSVAFKTVPKDSTGVAHILEHTVLCGSKRFPVRDPFFSMLKRSLNTFMNAFTASDWTMYPFSTQNRKDFYNLMDVYLDSVFFPNIEELSFRQEGHRFEIEDNSQDPDSYKLVYKGIVYNEMKGAMSSPDQVLTRNLLKALYPSTTYKHNSGGDPVVIPTLTYDQLVAFHGRHYHPSNAFFYTYGNLPLTEHLNFITNKILNNFERIDPKTDVPPQPRWSKSKKVAYPYPLGQNEDPSKKYQICLAWLTSDIKDTYEILILTLLEQILLGNPASPLRKALIDSGLGTALSDGTGFDADNRDTLFACGLKDVKESADGKIEEIIFDVLKNLVTEGIDKKLIESAIHQIEFHRKEITNTPYPYGIKLLLLFSGCWFHGGDPERILKFTADLKRLRDELSKGPVFENRIIKYFLDNPHRVLFKLVPDQLMEQRENLRATAELESIKAKMSRYDLNKIKENGDALKQLQDTTEDISCLPTLERKDIPPSIEIIKETTSYSIAKATCYKQPTSGIFYFSTVAGTGSLQKRLIPLVPFFCFALPKIGTLIHDFTEVAQRIDAYTGGISLLANARTSFDAQGSCVPFISLNGKCLVRNQERMFEIIEELLCKFDFSDLVRIKSLLLEYRAGIESMIIHNGHRFAISLASRNFSQAFALSEIWSGIHQLQSIKDITDNLKDDKLKSISEDLALIGKSLLTNNKLKIVLIGEDQALSDASSHTVSLQNELVKGESDGFVPPEITVGDKIPREGWSTSSAISFVAQTFKTVNMEHEDAPALSVISKILRSMYIHREIREKGGAYGGYASYNLENGLFCFASYRDPHIVSTLNVYEAARSFIRSGRYNDEDVKEAILQICSGIDKPDPPGPAARKAFYRKLVSLTDESRKRFKRKLLELTCKEVAGVAEKYFDGNRENWAVAVISGEDRLKEANKKIEGDPLELNRI